MSRKQHLLSKSLILAAALTSGAVFADDSSMSRFGGDSYAYFNRPPAAAAGPSWRQSHPNGLPEQELQALSSSSLAIWQAPNRSNVSSARSNVARSADKETFAGR